jgi:hypothetical protein
MLEGSSQIKVITQIESRKSIKVVKLYFYI